MQNEIVLELRALKAPRLLKFNEKKEPVFGDVWAIHNVENSNESFSLAVKCGIETIPSLQQIAVGSKFTVKGRLNISKDDSTGIFHTAIFADEITDIIASRKQQP